MSFTALNYKDIVIYKWNNLKEITSPIYNIDFLSWELIIYSRGINNSYEHYLSIFLGLKTGDNNSVYYLI